ncbi:MAG TPA: DUF2244 domain-containing protein [Usitatibacter sp.]|nr:DUF2244 domain-containing protein [Usitatibacter sp.]
MPNRSLGVAARRWVLGWIALTSLGISAGAAFFGAWPVMPFAGVEVAFVALAFHILGRHDADFERLEVGRHEVRLESRDARALTRFVAYQPWACIEVRERGVRCALSLAYAGRNVPLGRLLSDEGRRRLAEDLRGRIALRELRETRITKAWPCF